MKKLMIMMAIATVAAIANAGAINWSLLNLTTSPDTASKATASYTAYLFVGTDIASTTALLQAGKFDDFVSAASASKASSYVAATDMLNIVGGNTGDYKDTTVSAYAIILDSATASKASYYLIAKGGTGTSGTDGAEIITQTFGSTGNKTFAWGQQNANTGWTAVPEPTSGLLMLIGMAGLALRRRRV